jgi:membrane protein required for colicin V production
MTPYDVFMIVLLLGGMAWGAWKGMTWQVAGLASLVLGYMVAFPVSAQLAPRFPGEPVVARGLALLVSYVAVSFGVFFLAWTIRAALRRLKFEAYDRHLGMVLGGLEGAVLGLVATVLAISVAPDWREPILTSPTGKCVDRVLEVAGPALPAELREHLEPFWANLRSDGPRTADEAIDQAIAKGEGLFRDVLDEAKAEARREVSDRIDSVLETSSNRSANGGTRGPGRR